MGTHYKGAGWDVEVCDLRPEIAFSDKRSLDGEVIKYDGITISERTDITRACGNFDSDHLVKGVVRTGFPLSVLEAKLDEKEYDFITISACGSKTDVSSTSWIYVYMGVYECVAKCKEKQPNAEIQIVGKFADLYYDVAMASGADYVKEESPAINFIHIDTDLFERELPHRIDISTSMGCGNACAFCFVPVIEGTQRIERDVDDVLLQMEGLINQGITRFRFVDSNLLDNWDNHFKLILEGIIDKGWELDLTSYGGVEPSKFFEEQANLMKSAGFSNVIVPLDNCDQKTLQDWGNTKSVDEWKRAAAISKSVFGSVESYIMIGYPGQTYNNITDSIQICQQEGVNPALLPFTPLAGTCYEDTTIHPEHQHPLLWPYASADMTATQLENILDQYSDWYDSDAVDASIATRRTIIRSSPAIPINTT
jgi:hypothetical protein